MELWPPPATHRNRSAPLVSSSIEAAPDRARPPPRSRTETSRTGRYEPLRRVQIDDGWDSLDELPPFKTEVQIERPRKIITTNDLAGYRLRPVDQPLSRLRARLRLPLRAADPRLYGPLARTRFRNQALREARRRRGSSRRSSRPGYKVDKIAIGTNTDPYQPIEKKHRIMREVLEVLSRASTIPSAS